MSLLFSKPTSSNEFQILNPVPPTFGVGSLGEIDKGMARPMSECHLFELFVETLPVNGDRVMVGFDFRFSLKLVGFKAEGKNHGVPNGNVTKSIIIPNLDLTSADHRQ